jgi:3-hydroxyanthranilate 3,4-dioxygenase
MSSVAAHEHVESWYKKYEHEFQPPICNKLLHRNQLAVMFVGGPNTRKDFHLDLGAEFFFQLRGSLVLPTVQAGKRVEVRIPAGHVFLLPSRIPHSPQRPDTGSLGLVVERRRYDDELDCLRYYQDFETAKDIQWQHYFHCFDLGRDLVPVVKQYQAYVEAGKDEPVEASAWEQDTTTTIPAPFALQPWLDDHAADLAAGKVLSLFGDDHPDSQTSVLVSGGPCEVAGGSATDECLETLLFQHKGSATVTFEGPEAATPTNLSEGEVLVCKAGSAFVVRGAKDAITLHVSMDPNGGKQKRKVRKTVYE